MNTLADCALKISPLEFPSVISVSEFKFFPIRVLGFLSTFWAIQFLSSLIPCYRYIFRYSSPTYIVKCQCLSRTCVRVLLKRNLQLWMQGNLANLLFKITVCTCV